MLYYKIKSLTNTLDKRNNYKNRDLTINYNQGLLRKEYTLPTGNEIIFSCANLPVDIRKLEMQKLIIVENISESQFIKLQKPSSKKNVEEKKEIIKPTTTPKPITTQKSSTSITKKSTSKKSSSDKEKEDDEKE